MSLRFTRRSMGCALKVGQNPAPGASQLREASRSPEPANQESAMTAAFSGDRLRLALLRDFSAAMQHTPALWLFWWPVLSACEAEAAWLEQTLAYRSSAFTKSDKVID